jgi:hypothetical protein
MEPLLKINFPTLIIFPVKTLNTLHYFLLDFSAGANKDFNAELCKRESRRGGEVHTNMEFVSG